VHVNCRHSCTLAKPPRLHHEPRRKKRWDSRSLGIFFKLDFPGQARRPQPRPRHIRTASGENLLLSPPTPASFSSRYPHPPRGCSIPRVIFPPLLLAPSRGNHRALQTPTILRHRNSYIPGVGPTAEKFTDRGGAIKGPDRLYLLLPLQMANPTTGAARQGGS